MAPVKCEWRGAVMGDMNIVGYRGEVRSKYNNSTIDCTDIMKTEEGARRSAEYLRKKSTFPDEAFVRVVRLEEHIL